MSANVANLVQGPATLFIGAFSLTGAAEPADAAVNATPAASAWTDLGGTSGGATISIAQDYKELDVDQVVDIAGRRLTKRDMTVKVDLAEPTLANLTYALNDGVAATGTGYSNYTPAFTDSATQPTYRALIVWGWAAASGANNQSKRRMVILRKVLSTDHVDFHYKKDDQTVFTTTWSVHYVSSTLAPFKIVDEA